MSSDVAALRAQVDLLVRNGDLGTLRMIEAELAAAVARREHDALLVAEAEQYGELTSDGPFARLYQGVENGVPVTTLLFLHANGAVGVTHQIVGVRAECLT